MPAQRRPVFSSTVSISRRAISLERDPTTSLTLSAFTDAALASPGRSMAHRSDASPVRFTPNLNPGSGIFREELRTFSPRTLRHVSRPSGRRHKHLPPARRSIASAAPCRRLHRKTPDVSHRIGHFPEFYASSPARPLRRRPRRRHPPTPSTVSAPTDRSPPRLSSLPRTIPCRMAVPHARELEPAAPGGRECRVDARPQCSGRQPRFVVTSVPCLCVFRQDGCGHQSEAG